MSRNVDERVVSMQFDNKQFEQNARTSMSTLDKLKQKLNLSGAAKGLNEVHAASKKINFNEMENAAYKSGFHIQDIWLKTASVIEYQVAGKIVNAAKNMLNALTVAPVGDGFREYEMTLNAVQTTMAGTGKTAKEVEKELKKLDEYADKTVYSTADMLNNLPKFTNAGVDLEVATKAMIGIANATALAGGDAGKASIAFYNLGQAIGTGYLTRMDYNSINNAGIATMEWKNQMVEAAIAQGTLTKVGEDAYKAGNKTLTLQQLFIDGLQEQWATTEVMTKVFGDYGDETTAIGKKAYSAAQDIKTFTMMMDSLKATAGTGWKDTWQIIFGDLDEAKEFWTSLTNFISNVINTLDDWRNTLLATALQSPFSKISEGMAKLGETASKVTQPMQDLSEIVDRVSNGEFGETEERWNKLTEMGYDWIKVQNLVNEKEGSSFRRQEQANEATEEAVETKQELNDALLKEIGLTEDEIEVYKKLQDISKKTGIPMEEINGRMLLIDSFRNIGKALVSVFTQLKNAWSDTFSPLRPVQLLNIISKFHDFTESLKLNHDQSYKLWRTFRGLFAIIDLVATVTGGAFRIAFTIAKELLKYFNLDILDVTAAIGDAIVRFHEWFESVFDIGAVLDIVVPIIARLVGSIRNLINSVKESQAFNTFVDRIRSITSAIRDWFAGMKDAENLPQYIAKGIGTAIGSVLKFVRDDLLGNLIKLMTGGFSDIGKFVSEGFVGGLRSGVKNVWDTIKEFATTIITTACGILRVESPSKVFFAIGGFVVAGFILGFRDKIGEVWPALGEFANGVVNFIKDFDFGKLFATAGSVALMAFAKSMIDVASGINEVLEGVGATLVSFAYTTKQFGTAIKRLSKAVSNSMNALAFKQFAISIAILVGAVVVLALIASQEGMIKNLWIAVGIVAALAAIMAALFLAITKMNTPKGSVDTKTVIVNMASITSAILAIGASMLMMALAAKLIGDMDWKTMGRVGAGLAGLAVIMVGIMWGTKLLAKSTSSAQTMLGSTKTTVEIAAIGATLMQIAAAVLILVIAAKIIAGMSWDDLKLAGAGLAGLAVIMVGIMWGTKLLAKTKAGSINAGLMSVGKMLLSIAAAMLILVIAAKIIAGMSWDDMGKAGLGLIILAGILLAFMEGTQLIVKTAKGGLSTQLSKIGTMLLSMALAMAVLAITAKIIASMEWSDMGKAAVGIIGLTGIMLALVAITRVAGGNDLKGVAVTLLAMSAAIAVMAIMTVVLSLISLPDLAKGVIAMALLGGIVVAMVAVTKSAKDVKGTMLGIAAAIAVMAAAIVILSYIDPEDLVAPTLALAALMGMFALITSQSGKAEKATGVILMMTLSIMAIATMIVWLADMPVEGVLGSAIALSLVLSVMTAALLALQKVPGDKTMVAKIAMLALMAVPLIAFVGVLAAMQGVQNALNNVIALSALAAAMTVLLIPLSMVGKANVKDIALGVIALAAMAIPLIAFVGVLAVMQGVQNAMTNALALTALATAMTVLLIPLSIIGVLIGATGGMMLLGVAALAAMAIPMIAFVGILAAMQGIQNASANAALLIALMSSLTEMLVMIALVAPLAVVAVAAVAALVGVITAVGVLATAIGALMTQFPQLEEFLNKGLPILEKIAGSIGTMIGNFIAGFTTAIAESLPNLGLCLSQFMANAMVFIAGAKTIDESVLQGVKTLVSTIMMITGAKFLESITSWLTGGSSIADFGVEIVSFGHSLKAFNDAVAGVDPAIIQAAANAAKTLAQMADMIPNQGGVAAWFAGENSLAAFGPQIESFGGHLAAFANAVANVNPEAVKAAAEAGKSLAQMADTIPNQGGVSAWFAGDNSLAKFGPQVASFGTHLAKFATAVANINPEAVKAAASAGKSLAEMASVIPNQGGVAAWFTGDNSLAAFGPQIAAFGTHLAGFAANVGGIVPENVTAAANAGKAIAELAKLQPNGEGLEDFGSSIAYFGSKIAKFAENAAGTSPKVVTDYINGIKPVFDAASSLNESSGENLKALGDGLQDFAKRLSKFQDLMKGLNFVTLASSLDSFDKVLTKLNTTGQTSTKFSTGAEKIVTAFAETIISKGATLKKSVKSMAESLASAIKTKYGSWKTAGTHLVDGFAAGISARTWKAEAKATAMASAALKAAKEALRINSPSKAFRDIGMSVPEGFAMGIDKLGGMVKNSAVDMADGALDGTKTAIARIADAINADIETQPTIRPVLDLSDVQSGANSLSGMFGMTPSIGVLANVGAISSMMNNRQNGANDDVISALKDLKSSLSGRTGDTYSIGGITYDDGSAVSEAVKTLVRAARIERRV